MSFAQGFMKNPQRPYRQDNSITAIVWMADNYKSLKIDLVSGNTFKTGPETAVKTRKAS